MADDDIEHVRERRRPENQLGFALQICALRHPGRLLGSGEIIPEEALNFIGAQLGITGDALLTYAARRQTRQEHLVALREIYGYRVFTGKRALQMKSWLEDQAEAAQSGEELARRFVEECRRRQVILPGMSTIERLCADALVAAECMTSQPATSSLALCISRSWLDELTRATPMRGRATCHIRVSCARHCH